jgi:hypothetical protein
VGPALGKADQEEAAEVLRLQGRLKQRHEALAALDDDGDLVAAVNKVFSAANDLVNYEARRPQMREERHRKVSSMIVYVATGVAAAAMLAEVALMLLDRVSWWYLIPVVVVLAFASAVGGTERNADTAGHRGRAAGAVVIALAAALVVVVTFHVLSAYILILLVPALLAVGISKLVSSEGAGEAQ